ncbi:L-threonylcarbamoyladenylate synthase, partial [Staphylococcus aureus]|uniref:L-threonylcarbamoyladenylate synthase n=1 Tax=Staphylococcus aureus TaxID=1280 RepID=UPI00210B6F3D
QVKPQQIVTNALKHAKEEHLDFVIIDTAGRLPIDEALMHELKEVKDIVLNGGLIGLPTETVYGLAANATDDEAVAKIYEAKGRPSDNPLIVHIHSKGQLQDFTYTLDPRVEKLMQAFWQGPISFILP